MLRSFFAQLRNYAPEPSSSFMDLPVTRAYCEWARGSSLLLGDRLSDIRRRYWPGLLLFVLSLAVMLGVGGGSAWLATRALLVAAVAGCLAGGLIVVLLGIGAADLLLPRLEAHHWRPSQNAVLGFVLIIVGFVLTSRKLAPLVFVTAGFAMTAAFAAMLWTQLRHRFRRDREDVDAANYGSTFATAAFSSTLLFCLPALLIACGARLMASSIRHCEAAGKSHIDLTLE